MKKLKKYYKIIIAVLIVVVISILSFLIYINLFKENDSNRLENIDEHKLTKKEISKAKETFEELEQLKKDPKVIRYLEICDIENKEIPKDENLIRYSFLKFENLQLLSKSNQRFHQAIQYFHPLQANLKNHIVRAATILWH